MKFYSDYFASGLIPDRNFLKLHTITSMQLHYCLLQIHTNMDNDTLFFWQYNGLWVILNISARFAFIGPKNLNYLTWQLFGFLAYKMKVISETLSWALHLISTFLLRATLSSELATISLALRFFWYNRCLGLSTCPCDLISWFKTNAKCAFKGEVRITKD